MSVSSSTPQDTQAAIAVVVVLLAGWSVVYWRTALKVALIVVLALVAYAVITGFHEASSLLATHHH